MTGLFPGQTCIYCIQVLGLIITCSYVALENFGELRRDYLWTTLGVSGLLWRTLKMGPHLGEFDQVGDERGNLATIARVQIRISEEGGNWINLHFERLWYGTPE
ncbi:hypothetical protein B0J17DRAFT_627543 [Rhizoctonia solani]|nr:hypothetical protein B0J17DRAFT_627543 [Rhizoctonia solani]